MDALRDLKTLTLPISTKVGVVLLLLFSVGVNLLLLARGVIKNESSLLTSSVETLAALLPVVLVVLVLSRADTGVAALKRRTETLLLKVAPQALAGVVEEPLAFYEPGRNTRAPVAPRRGRVYVNLKRGECFADLLVIAPWTDRGATPRWKIIPIRLEINVGRVNFNLLIPDHVGRRSPESVSAAFAHTTQGAGRAGPTEPGRPESTGYAFLDTPLRRDLSGSPCTALVASKFVSGDSLWDSASQLYFAQDLMFMLRAFLAERPDMFVTVAGASPPSAVEAERAIRTPPSNESHGSGESIPLA